MGDQLVEQRRVFRRELEPGEEVERLAEIAAVIQATGDRRQVLQAGADVVRDGFEDRPPLVLGKVPPRVALADRDQRRACRLRPPQRRLDGDEPFVLGAFDLALMAGGASQGPLCAADIGCGAGMRRQPLRVWQRRAGDRNNAIDPPLAVAAGRERYRDNRRHVAPLAAFLTARCTAR